MELAVAIVAIVGGVLAFIKLIHTISSGFTKVEAGQESLREDFDDLKTEMRDTNKQLGEMEKDLVWVQAHTKTPKRVRS